MATPEARIAALVHEITQLRPQSEAVANQVEVAKGLRDEIAQLGAELEAVRNELTLAKGPNLDLERKLTEAILTLETAARLIGELEARLQAIGTTPSPLHFVMAFGAGVALTAVVAIVLLKRKAS